MPSHVLTQHVIAGHYNFLRRRRILRVDTLSAELVKVTCR